MPAALATVTLPFAVKLIVAPDSAPGVVNVVPLLNVRLAVPVLIDAAGKVSAPPATRLIELFAEADKALTVNALVSRIDTDPPVRDTELKSLAAFVRVILPVGEENVVSVGPVVTALV